MDFPAPLAPMMAVLDESVRAHVTSWRDGFGAPGYVYVQFVILIIALVEDLTPDKRPGEGNLN